MNQSRSGRKFGFFKKPARDLLPTMPVETIQILPWWMVQVGFVTEEDMKVRQRKRNILPESWVKKKLSSLF